MEKYKEYNRTCGKNVLGKINKNKCQKGVRISNYGMTDAI